MVLDPGIFDRKIIIQSYTVAKDTFGQAVKTWSTYATIQAAMGYDWSGREGELVGVLAATSDIRWTIRYKSGVTEKMRISYGSDYYWIKQVITRGRLQYMELVTEKRDND